MRLDRRTYADHYGPTTGDRLRLADTDLVVQIERDSTVYGDEAKFGGGKVIRDGMGQSPTASRASGSPDLVITSVVVLDSSGIYKADVGIRDGRIAAIGKSGNPGVMDGVTPGLEISASTEVLAGEGHILTAGAIDSHVHFISPNQIPDAFHSGITTLIGGGTGPARRRRVRRPGGDSHRHAERNRIRRGHDRGHRRPDDSYLPHRGRRGGARPRHHPHVRRAERASFVHEPDDAVYAEYAGRTSR